jgi:hypothetical protein
MNRFRHAALLLVAMSALLRADTALLTLVSPDAKAIGGIDVTQTRNSPFGQFLLSQMKEDDAGFREFMNATGFDPRNDLNYVVFASPAEGSKRGVVIARGRFNGPQILAAAKAKGATTVNYRGIDLLQHGTSVLAVIDGQLAIAGDDAMVKAAIDRRALSGPAAVPLVQKASTFSTRYHSWMVTSGMNTRLPQMGGRPGAPNPAFESILETGGGVNFGTVIQIEGEALTKTDADAKALVQIAQFLTGMMALNQDKSPQAQQIQNILQTLDVKTQGTVVKMSLRVSETDLEEIIKTPKRVRRSASL